MPALILAVVAATLQLAPAGAQAAENVSRQQQIQASAKKVKELQQERIAALKDALEIFSGLFRSGRAGLDEIVDAHQQLLEAELEVAEKQSDRIALYKNMVDMLKGYEQAAAEHVLNARGNRGSALMIKARRLEAEIRLERAKGKQAEVSK